MTPPSPTPMPPPDAWLWVLVGGGLGSLARYAVSSWLHGQWGHGFPWGTLAVNALGCGLIGLASAWPGWPPAARLGCVTGFLGGFTTFSAFGLETLTLANAGRWLLMGSNVLANVVLGLLAAGLGQRLGRLLLGG